MKPLERALCLCVPLMLGGVLAWTRSALAAKAWLRRNDPGYRQASPSEEMILGGVLTAIGPMRRYRELRLARGESTTVVTLFWAGIATALGALALLYFLTRNS